MVSQTGSVTESESDADIFVEERGYEDIDDAVCSYTPRIHMWILENDFFPI